jgi:integrase
VDGDPEKGPVHILSAAEMKLLLRLAESDERFHCMIMPLSTQAFLCLRRCEAKRFPSFQFNTEIRQYDVVAKRTRSRKNRDVETNPTFDAWRKRYWTSGTKLYPDKYADLLRQMVSELGLEWTRNTIRHTAASNYLVAYGEEATVKQLGHRDSDMLYKHYRRKVSPYENGLFWAILPLEKIDGKGTLVDVPLVDPAADKTQIGGQRYGSMRM